MGEFSEVVLPFGQSETVKIELADRLRRSMTTAEKVLWSQLRSHRLAGLHFRRQTVIRGFIADFYCHEVGLVIEVDGPVHSLQAEYDTERDDIMRDLNLHVLRFTNDAVLNRITSVLETIKDTAQARQT